MYNIIQKRPTCTLEKRQLIYNYFQFYSYQTIITSI